MEEQSLLNSEDIAKQISNTSIDLSIEYVELGIDKIIENPILKEIPLVKSLVSVAKIGFAIKEKFFVKKFLTFLKEFHSGKINEEKLEDFKNKFNSDFVYREKVTEQLILLNDSFNAVSKAKILGHLFATYIEDVFDWKRFLQLADCLDKLQEAGYRYLAEYKNNNPPFTSRGNDDEGEALMFSAGIGHRYGTIFRITSLGQELYTHGISEIKK